MFERFTSEAVAAVVGAQTHARELGSAQIRPLHLLLGVLDRRGSGSAVVLRRHGLDTEVVRQRVTGLDPDALKSVGIDLDAVRASVDAAFGSGALERNAEPPGRRHLPFTREAKDALKSALDEAKQRRNRSIGCGHIVLGVVGAEDSALRRLLQDVGVDPEVLRADAAAALEE